LSIVRQFLHQVAHMSMITGFCSRVAVARPAASDGVHPSAAPNSADFTPENLQYGMTVRNLTALQALDAVWRGAMYP